MTEEELTQEQVEEMADSIPQDYIVSFLTDLFLFNSMIENGGYLSVTEEQAKKVEEMRETRIVEFSSVEEEDGTKTVYAKLVYRGEEEDKDEKESDA